MSNSGYPSVIPLSDEAREQELCDLSLHVPPPVHHTAPESFQSPRSHGQVSLDYFDREGMISLSRTLSKPSGQHADSAARQPSDKEKERGPLHVSPPVHSDSDSLSPLANTCSRVSVDYFDPEGARFLSRSLSGLSFSPNRSSSLHDQSLRTSEATTARDVTDEPFDFEKIVRGYLKKYVGIYDNVSVSKL